MKVIEVPRPVRPEPTLSKLYIALMADAIGRSEAETKRLFNIN